MSWMNIIKHVPFDDNLQRARNYLKNANKNSKTYKIIQMLYDSWEEDNFCRDCDSFRIFMEQVRILKPFKLMA